MRRGALLGAILFAVPAYSQTPPPPQTEADLVLFGVDGQSAPPSNILPLFPFHPSSASTGWFSLGLTDQVSQQHEQQGTGTVTLDQNRTDVRMHLSVTLDDPDGFFLPFEFVDVKFKVQYLGHVNLSVAAGIDGEMDSASANGIGVARALIGGSETGSASCQTSPTPRSNWGVRDGYLTIGHLHQAGLGWVPVPQYRVIDSEVRTLVLARQAVGSSTYTTRFPDGQTPAFVEPYLISTPSIRGSLNATISGNGSTLSSLIVSGATRVQVRDVKVIGATPLFP